MLAPPSLKKSPEFSQKSFTRSKQKRLHQSNHLTSPSSLWIVQQSLISLSMNGEPAAPKKTPSRGDGLYEWTDERRLCGPRAWQSPGCPPEAHRCPAASQQSTCHMLCTAWTAFCSFEEYDHLHNHLCVDLCVSPCVNTCARDSALRIYRGEREGESVCNREGEKHMYPRISSISTAELHESKPGVWGEMRAWINGNKQPPGLCRRTSAHTHTNAGRSIFK